ncbi:T9SS type B sorting domain-containing protein [Vicingus serpentipes]|uniref:T9SS type B sorting domain-containing protein n=1 Tax=Vicingus serpentipes TaxID=1926625 RepID=A0A5C6RSM4_9FLAO|nr:gliding motility-associated C-terminal domain-containing protein [Vicingus serpentipes]TXB64312.1 T9SS type B sorting domain-containing protein [Vicingus serpentipes]
MKNLFLGILYILSVTLYSQSTILISDSDLDLLNPLDCNANSGPIANFFDTGNNSANYSDNENDTIVVCPDYAGSTTKLSASFGISAGLLFDVDASDTIFVYDGIGVNAPLLGKHNSSTDPLGFNYIASFENNATGCLTFRFKSDLAVTGTGWDANLSCIQLPQPFTPHMEAFVNGAGANALNPSDTGYVDVCFGDSILFVAGDQFPYSLENTGLGYSQNSSNVTYKWSFSDGTTALGDSVWFTPPARSGYLATLKITDQFPQSQSIISKVRVSTIPSFSGIINNRDSICFGDTTVIIGGVTATDTVGVDPSEANFQLGGTFAGLVYLPDGSGINYTDTINISGFLPGQTLTSVSDLEQLCLNMEHSYLGDLEMTLTCPNGTAISIFNSYSPGIIPGGFNGGGTFLGNAFDANIGTPGVGMEYCWSSTYNTWGDFPTEFGNNNFVNVTNPVNGNAMNPNGIYLPEDSFLDFAGCPLNGNWYITVRDNIGTDDGFIFEWGILFDPTINPNNETYTTSIVDEGWLSDPSIISGENDTAIVVQPPTTGIYNYTYAVTDNYGCDYDTTVSVYVLPTPELRTDTTACNNQFQITGTSSYLNQGFWTGSGPGTVNFSPNNTNLNPLVNVTAEGSYTLYYTDDQCSLTDSFDIIFAPSPVIQSDTTICIQDYQVAGTSSYDGGQWTYNGPGTATFLPNDTTSNPQVMVDSEGLYTLTYTDNQCAIANSFLLNVVQTPSVPLSDTSCVNQFQFVGTSSYDGGQWTYSGPGTVTFTTSESVENPLVEVDKKGLYEFTFTDNQCAKDSTFEVYFPQYVVSNLVDLTFCFGSEETFDVSTSVAEASFLWSTGSTAPSITVQDSGIYYVEITGLCNSVEDSAMVTLNDCTLSGVNVITPNGDGFNDFLVFPNLNYYPESSLVIFNRWGNKIYETDNYKNDWDGSDQSDGTYFYVLVPDGASVDAKLIKGTFTLLK